MEQTATWNKASSYQLWYFSELRAWLGPVTAELFHNPLHWVVLWKTARAAFRGLHLPCLGLDVDLAEIWGTSSLLGWGRGIHALLQGCRAAEKRNLTLWASSGVIPMCRDWSQANGKSCVCKLLQTLSRDTRPLGYNNRVVNGAVFFSLWFLFSLPSPF